MRAQTITEENTASELTPPITPTMPWRVAHVEAIDGFRLKVRFRDGLEGIVDMADLVHSADAGVFAVLAQASLFRQAHLVHGVVTWPGELDLAPDAMYRHIKAEGTWRLR